jgi:helicase
MAVPTASGKTLIAYLAALKFALEGGKVMYIVPLRALASEKYEELKEYEKIGVKVGISMGDYDAPDPSLEDFDILIATSEKADSLLRHKVDWLGRLKLVVADEVHLINDSERGPTLEVILTRLKQINPDAQIIALSATIRNSNEIAKWLDAAHIQSDWRPVPLKEGVFQEDTIYFMDNTKEELRSIGQDVYTLVLDSVNRQHQCLVFVNTRRSTESLAAKLGPIISQTQDSKGEKDLMELSDEIIKGQSEPTIIGRKLANCVRQGAAFHNAGLTNDQRKTVEKAFKKGLLRCIVATPTLAAGINLPARRVIIRDYKRYEANLGSVPIPNLEIKQMSGRAGRPQYDDVGEALLIAKRDPEREFLFENYILSDTEAIFSKLGTEPALRKHLLAIIASQIAETEEEIETFLEGTFFGYHQDIWTISTRIEDILIYLEENELIESGDKIRATPFGSKTSSLYIDPISGVRMKEALSNLGKGKDPSFPILHAISGTPDMLKLYLTKGDYARVKTKLMEYESEFLLPIPEDDNEFEWFLSEVKTACLLHDWIEEVPEDEIVQKYKVGPGDIRNKIETAQWLLHSMFELGRLFNNPRKKSVAETLLRIEQGIKGELLALVKLRQIGRVRARVLFNAGYKSPKDLKGVNADKLAKLPNIGPGIAKGIIEQAEGKKERGQSKFEF